MSDRRDFDDLEDDDSLDDETWFEDDADESVMPCPYCGAEIYDDAVRCPVCDQYLSDAERTATTQPRWVVVTALVLLAALALAFLR